MVSTATATAIVVPVWAAEFFLYDPGSSFYAVNTEYVMEITAPPFGDVWQLTPSGQLMDVSTGQFAFYSEESGSIGSYISFYPAGSLPATAVASEYTSLPCTVTPDGFLDCSGNGLFTTLQFCPAGVLIMKSTTPPTEYCGPVLSLVAITAGYHYYP